MESAVAKVLEIEESSDDMRIAWELLVKTKAEPAGPFNILLADDNLADVRMVTEGLRETIPSARLSVVRDGAEAIQFLRRENEYSQAPRPDLVLLDLRMPKKSGFEVLREIKEDRTLSNIPVVVQSCSESALDVHKAYSLRANSYITKPIGIDEFTRAMRALVEFWVVVAKLPNGGPLRSTYD
jgi:two-component system, chemotaxis family, response regulator Rcp1